MQTLYKYTDANLFAYNPKKIKIPKIEFSMKVKMLKEKYMKMKSKIKSYGQVEVI